MPDEEKPLILKEVSVMSQLTTDDAQQFDLKVPARSERLARQRARFWARKAFPQFMGFVFVSKAEDQKRLSTRVQRIIPGPIRKTDHRVTVTLEEG